MTSEREKGRPLPKFGEWDVNNPSSAEGFTVIFARARDDKKGNGAAGKGGAPRPQPQKNDSTSNLNHLIIFGTPQGKGGVAVSKAVLVPEESLMVGIGRSCIIYISWR